MSYLTNIVYDTTENQNFRTVLYTGAKSQLVVMSIPPGGEIGMETHDSVEQTLFFLSGSGTAILNGERQKVRQGDVLVVTPGTDHNVMNTGTMPLKIYTIYAPPNHLDGRIHATKADADRDLEDEAFGDAVGGNLTTDASSDSKNRGMLGNAMITSGYLPDIEPSAEPGNPTENPNPPAISVHDESRKEVGE